MISIIRRPYLALLATVLLALSSVCLTPGAHAAETLKWENFAPSWDDSRNPVPKLSQTQQDDVYTLLWGPAYEDPKVKGNDEEQAA